MKKIIADKTDFRTFFAEAKLNPNVHKIAGVICGYRVEEIEDHSCSRFTYLDKLVDELAKCREMEKKILRVKVVRKLEHQDAKGFGPSDCLAMEDFGFFLPYLAVLILFLLVIGLSVWWVVRIVKAFRAGRKRAGRVCISDYSLRWRATHPVAVRCSAIVGISASWTKLRS